MYKKTKVVLLLVSSLLLTSCYTSVHSEIGFGTRNAVELTTPQQQNEAFDFVAGSILAPANNNNHVISIDNDLSAWPLWASISGYAYYNYNSNDDTATFQFSNATTPQTNVNLEADQTLDLSVSLFGIDLFKLDNQQLNFDAKPLNELLDFSLITSIDKTAIQRYRKINSWDVRFDQFSGGWWGGYVFDIDDQYVNQLLNSSNIKFISDLVVVVLYKDFYFIPNNEVKIIHISGTIRINDSINVELKSFIYFLD